MEHMRQNHPNEDSFECSVSILLIMICNAFFALISIVKIRIKLLLNVLIFFWFQFCAKSYSQQLLIDHLREHGLHLYQCVWCVNGFDSETKFLDHISLVHPDRKPSAYLRHIIDNNPVSIELYY